MVSKLPPLSYPAFFFFFFLLLFFFSSFLEWEILHQHPPDLSAPVCGYTTVAVRATFPSRPPSSSCSCHNYPISDKLSSCLISLVWLWMGSLGGYWWQAGLSRGCTLGKSRGGEEKRERKREGERFPSRFIIIYIS